MDCIHVKVRDSGAVRVKALYLAIGVNLEGIKEVLGLWMAQTEGAKFWLQVVTELKNRGVADIFIACVDGLKGFPDAIEAVFPKTAVQLCLVHMVRHSLNFVGWKQRKEVAADLRLIYSAATQDEALLRLTEFEAKWDASFAPIGQSWRRNWARLTPFFDYPADSVASVTALSASRVRRWRKSLHIEGSRVCGVVCECLGLRVGKHAAQVAFQCFELVCGEAGQLCVLHITKNAGYFFCGGGASISQMNIHYPTVRFGTNPLAQAFGFQAVQ
jgi:hypothetical protein